MRPSWMLWWLGRFRSGLSAAMRTEVAASFRRLDDFGDSDWKMMAEKREPRSRRQRRVARVAAEIERAMVE